MSFLEIVTLADQLQQHLIDTSRVAILVSRDEWDAMVDDFCDSTIRTLDGVERDKIKSHPYGSIYGVTVMVDPKEKQ